MQDDRLGLTEKSLRMYLVVALLFLVVTMIELGVYVTHSFGNSVENVASSFWVAGTLCLGNVGLYLYARQKSRKQRRLLLEPQLT
ncbi:MAG: hypothetical protein ACHQ1H_01985 [Nitrososphaerales archaeon]